MRNLANCGNLKTEFCRQSTRASASKKCWAEKGENKGEEHEEPLAPESSRPGRSRNTRENRLYHLPRTHTHLIAACAPRRRCAAPMGRAKVGPRTGPERRQERRTLRRRQHYPHSRTRTSRTVARSAATCRRCSRGTPCRFTEAFRMNQGVRNLPAIFIGLLGVNRTGWLPSLIMTR